MGTVKDGERHEVPDSAVSDSGRGGNGDAELAVAATRLDAVRIGEVLAARRPLASLYEGKIFDCSKGEGVWEPPF